MHHEENVQGSRARNMVGLVPVEVDQRLVNGHLLLPLLDVVGGEHVTQVGGGEPSKGPRQQVVRELVGLHEESADSLATLSQQPYNVDIERVNTK